MTRTLTFPWSSVARLVTELETAKQVRSLYGRTTGKGLWLVGDEGVYLMPNTADRKDQKNTLVVYAEQCDPTRMDFDEWWANKRALFGTDDSVDFIALATVKSLLTKPPRPGLKPSRFSVTIVGDALEINIYWRPNPECKRGSGRQSRTA